MIYYAISDIHGYLNILKETMKKVDLSNDNMLFFLGDYIDDGPHSRQTLEYIYNLQKQYPNQVIVLKGNHEEWFIDWLEDEIEIAYFQADTNLETLKTFFNNNQIGIIANYLKNGKSIFEINSIIKEYVKANYPELIKWVKNLPSYYETENQIFVHAGIDEEAGEYWKLATENYYFTEKYPATTGKFYKDIVAGHIATSSLANNMNFHEIYFDGENHYYLDSTVQISKKLNLLIYDTETNKYVFE